MIKVLFICHGNICRSPMAEMVLKDLTRKNHIESDFLIASAATSREEIGNQVHSGTRRKLAEVGIPCECRAARQMTRQDYEDYDYILLMDANNKRNIARIIGEDTENKVHMLLEFTARKHQDIADPWYTGNFDETYDDILEGCQSLLKYLGYSQ